MVKQSFIPVRLQEEIDTRIAVAGGDAKQVRREVEAEIDKLEMSASADSADAMLPLLRGELLYLDSVIEAAGEGEVQHHPGLWERFSHFFKGDKPATTST